jgi:hypothetical protein
VTIDAVRLKTKKKDWCKQHRKVEFFRKFWTIRTEIAYEGYQSGATKEHEVQIWQTSKKKTTLGKKSVCLFKIFYSSSVQHYQNSFIEEDSLPFNLIWFKGTPSALCV